MKEGGRPPARRGAGGERAPHPGVRRPERPPSDRPRCVVVCGPTASGKSALADEFSENLSTHAILVDSMQVYREIPAITNQARSRPARLSSIISVTDEWSVADHREAVREEIRREPGGQPGMDDTFVLDAGTGMYLNAILFDIPLAPSVPGEARERASLLSEGEPNPRRSSRSKELELSLGRDGRGSIWDGELAYVTDVVYMRPGMAFLEGRIRSRSRRTMAPGAAEAEALSRMMSGGRHVNKSVLDSIGARELLLVAHGAMTPGDAEERMNIRTRRLAKRQIRWFDKLASKLRGRARVSVLDPSEGGANARNSMHGIIG